MHDVDSS
jgi:Fe2+ transport system protein FeoA